MKRSREERRDERDASSYDANFAGRADVVRRSPPLSLRLCGWRASRAIARAGRAPSRGLRRVRRAVEGYHSTDALLASLPATTPSPEVFHAVMAAAREQNAEPVERETLVSPFAGLAARRLRVVRPEPRQQDIPAVSRRAQEELGCDGGACGRSGAIGLAGGAGVPWAGDGATHGSSRHTNRRRDDRGANAGAGRRRSTGRSICPSDRSIQRIRPTGPVV